MKNIRGKLVIAGASGFLAKSFVDKMRHRFREIVLVSRKDPQIKAHGVSWHKWDGIHPESLFDALENTNLLLNFSGRNVDCRYNEKNRREILQSRTTSTYCLGEAINLCENPPEVWINAGSATYYRHAFEPQDEIQGEEGTGFSVEVCKAWEKAFWECQTPFTRKCVLRIAFALDSKTGAFPKLLQIVKMGVSKGIGDGNPFISWIHEEDIARGIMFLFEKSSLKGTFNLAAPEPVRMTTFLGECKKRTGTLISISIPTWLVTFGAWILRTEPELLLKSRCVYPQKLLAEGFHFRYPSLKMCLDNLIAPCLK